MQWLCRECRSPLNICDQAKSIIPIHNLIIFFTDLTEVARHEQEIDRIIFTKEFPLITIISFVRTFLYWVSDISLKFERLQDLQQRKHLCALHLLRENFNVNTFYGLDLPSRAIINNLKVWFLLLILLFYQEVRSIANFGVLLNSFWLFRDYKYRQQNSYH